MNPTDFQFTVTIPGDPRLVAAIKTLTAHAAGYARLADAARDGFAGQVERATEAALAACRREHHLIDFRFTGDAESLTVVISCDAAAAAPTPPSASTGGVTVNWVTEGSRHVCQIRQPLSA